MTLQVNIPLFPLFKSIVTYFSHVILFSSCLLSLFLSLVYLYLLFLSSLVIPSKTDNNNKVYFYRTCQNL